MDQEEYANVVDLVLNGERDGKSARYRDVVVDDQDIHSCVRAP